MPLVESHGVMQDDGLDGALKVETAFFDVLPVKLY